MPVESLWLRLASAFSFLAQEGRGPAASWGPPRGVRPEGFPWLLLLRLGGRHTCNTVTLGQRDSLPLLWSTSTQLNCQQRATLHMLCNHNNNNNACQPGLGACGASLSSPGSLVLSDLIGAGDRQMVNVRQHHLLQTIKTAYDLQSTWSLS